MKFELTPASISLAATAIGIGWLLANPADTPAEESGTPTAVNGIPVVDHVIYISIDGLRGDAIRSIIETRPDEFPNFKRFYDTGATTFRARTDFSFTETIPNHSGMVTGRPVYEPGTTTQAGVIGHGQVNNTGAGVTGLTSVIHNLGGNGAASSYKSSVFDVVHESGRPTAFFFSKNRLYFLVRSYNETFGADRTGEPGVVDPSPNKIDRASPASGFPSNASGVADVFVADADANGLAAFTMLHFIDPDTSVHRELVTTTAAPTSLSSYEIAISDSDSALGKIFAWLDAHPAEASCTTIIVSGDHGGVGGSAAHRDASRVENYTVPFFINGPGFAAGSDAYQYFANRSDPSIARSTDALTELPNPPLRNADMANLATSLLGLPFVPDSYFKPMLLNPNAMSLLTIAQTSTGNYEVSWPLSATSYSLETSRDLQAPNWTPITSEPMNVDDKNIHTVTAGEPGAFFRLRKL